MNIWYKVEDYFPQYESTVICKDHEGNQGVCLAVAPGEFFNYYEEINLGHITHWTYIIISLKDEGILYPDLTPISEEIFYPIDSNEVL
jgi:hypothetical protein